MKNETVIILDFGGQYKQLIARRVREQNVYSVILPCDASIETIKAYNPIGIIFTGGPNAVYMPDSPMCSAQIYLLGIPMLGICYGMQLMCHMLGGKVESCVSSEYGQTQLELKNTGCPIFKELSGSQTVLMSHTDMVTKLPEGFISAANTASCLNAAVYDEKRSFYGVQFHPEVEETKRGKEILHNFLYEVCHASGDYSMDDYLKTTVDEVRAKIGNEKVILGLSGGVDSSVCAAILSKAIGEQLICIFVDHGFMRKNEGDEIESVFSKRDLKFVRVDASERFLSAISGISDPEKKRKTIGRLFVEVFEEQASKFNDAKFLAQGTIYPDVIESGANHTATIKSHHNVGGLPEHTRFSGIVEPLRGLFKDEVRNLGRLLGLPDFLVNRQPFPGPGLAIRIIGEITREKLDILRDADAIFREEMKRSRVKASQYFAVLTDLKSVGVMGDFRTYDYTVALRAVKTNDFMTCEYAPLSHKLLKKVSSRITNEVKGVNRIVYDITGKPPATIEWE
ncbi:MAG: glutamine-hydrolyzing GMP synthase [Oscillospiraceae bacterium]|nr:glutamine-hydrolyzing GMP synthase [Oscillospiraceae bacterium]